MEDDAHILAIARAAIAEFGLNAFAALTKRAQEHADAKELEGEQLWRRAADAVVKILSNCQK